MRTLEPYVIVIENDLFDIARRLKEIDAGYIVVYNKKRRRFEVRHERTRESFACMLPFDRLDERTVRHVRKTRAENTERLLREIEKNNEKITAEKENRVLDELRKKSESLIRYLDGGGKEIPEYGKL
jgi:hypothetical protein